MHISKKPELRTKCTSLKTQSLEEKKHNSKKPELKANCTFLINQGKKPTVHL